MFVPLHVKSDYSLGYGTASIDELVERVASLGYAILALTDLENLYGQVRFHHQCRCRGIHPLTGIELRPGFDGRREFGRRAGRLVLLAADRWGYQSLCRIVTRRRAACASQQNEKLGQDPVSLVSSFSEGLFALSDDPLVLERLISNGDFSRDQLGLLLVRPDHLDTTTRHSEAARRLRVRLVADLDTIYLDQKDYPLHLLQIAVRQRQRLQESEKENPAEHRDRWLRAPTEAVNLFADIPEAITNTETIAGACQFDLGLGMAELPGPDLPMGVSAHGHLRQVCYDALAKQKKALAWEENHKNRLDEELDVFEQLRLSGFILIIAEILAHCRKKNIPVAARGSAVSSLTLHLLGASPVDPVAHGLFFERFLHAEKSSWPDVDLDLPWHRRDEVIDWVYKRFGHERVAMVAAHHTLQRRSALREGLKAWGFSPTLIQNLTRTLPAEDLGVEEVDFLELADAVQEDFIQAGQIEPGARKMLEEALPIIQRLIGRPHHVAAHPGGMVIGDHALENLLPLERAPKGVVITQYDLTSLDELGFVKIDLLGNRCLSEIEETRELAAGQESAHRMKKIPAEDPLTLDLINRADTIGCFQLESPAMRSLLSRLPIRKQNDLVAALALIRPGAAAGEAKSAFIRRARGEEPDEFLDPVLADRLGENHGMLVYEEDIMLLLSRLGGLSLSEADELRAAIIRSAGDQEVLGMLETRFLERARVFLGTDPDQVIRARRGWAATARFAAYTFNKAHAVSYAQLAYLSAYMKTHHLVEFSCALLNHHQGLYPLRTLASDLSRRGIELRAPHVNASDYHSVLERERTASNGVRVGLDKIKGLTIRTAGNLLEERAARGPFASLHDLFKRVHLSRTEAAALILSGACDGMRPLAAESYPFVHEAVLKFLREGGAPAELDRPQFKQEPKEASEPMRLYQALVRVRNELRYFQMHLSAPPMALLRDEASRYGCLTIRQAANSNKDSEVRLAVTVAAMRRVPTRHGVVQFLTLEDETGILEAALLPPTYQRLGERVITPGPFLVEGRLRCQQGALYLEVTEFSPFYQRKQPFGGRGGGFPKRE